MAPGDDLGVSLNLGKHASAKRPEGRSKHFKGLDTVWNNKYFQALDASTGAVSYTHLTLPTKA